MTAMLNIPTTYTRNVRSKQAYFFGHMDALKGRGNMVEKGLAVSMKNKTDEKKAYVAGYKAGLVEVTKTA